MPLARELGLLTSTLPTGKTNSIVDVPGVMVGHKTLRHANINTGVTAILPHGGNLFLEKVPAAAHIINGFGKSCGLMQVNELGTIETPILLSNTFAVGNCFNALVNHAISQNPEIGRQTSTVNPVVCECNDGHLSDIQKMPVTPQDALEAIQCACDKPFQQGSVGAGTGMRCFGLKGGIGSSSRSIRLGDKDHAIGIMVLSNFGSRENLILPNGKTLKSGKSEPDKGSIIIVLATDIPLEFRQIQRVIRRTGVGLARLGSFWGHGSGDIALGFSTAYHIPHNAPHSILPIHILAEEKMEELFYATADATIEAVLNSMTMSPATTGRDGSSVKSILDYL